MNPQDSGFPFTISRHTGKRWIVVPMKIENGGPIELIETIEPKYTGEKTIQL